MISKSPELLTIQGSGDSCFSRYSDSVAKVNHLGDLPNRTFVIKQNTFEEGILCDGCVF